MPKIDEAERCAACEGSGEIFRGVGGPDDPERCSDCGGTGTLAQPMRMREAYEHVLDEHEFWTDQHPATRAEILNNLLAAQPPAAPVETGCTSSDGGGESRPASTEPQASASRRPQGLIGEAGVAPSPSDHQCSAGTGDPFGWVAFYAGEKLFLTTKSAADLYGEFSEVIPVFRAAPQTPSIEDTRRKAEEAIRTFCHSLGAAAVQMSHGEERIYYAGISLKALSAAVALAMTRPHQRGGE